MKLMELLLGSKKRRHYPNEMDLASDGAIERADNSSMAELVRLLKQQDGDTSKESRANA